MTKRKIKVKFYPYEDDGVSYMQEKEYSNEDKKIVVLKDYKKKKKKEKKDGK